MKVAPFLLVLKFNIPVYIWDIVTQDSSWSCSDQLPSTLSLDFHHNPWFLTWGENRIPGRISTPNMVSQTKNTQNSHIHLTTVPTLNALNSVLSLLVLSCKSSLSFSILCLVRPYPISSFPFALSAILIKDLPYFSSASALYQIKWGTMN